MKSSSLFYGWKLCLVTFLGNFLLQGSVVFMMNAFLDPLSVLHGWTRAEISLGISVAALFGALSVPIWSSLSSYFSLRVLMTAGAFLGGLSFIILGITDKLIFFYIFYTVAWACGQAFGGALGNVLMNQWFVEKRGKAFGISNIGTSFSGAVMPFLLLLIISFFDVQTAWISYGSIILLLSPLCWIMVRDTPEEMGLYADNNPNVERNSKPKEKVVISWKEVLKDKDVYIISFAFCSALMVASSVVSQLQPRMVDIGLAKYPAMTLSCLTAFCLAIGKYLWGNACDKYNPIKVGRFLFLSILLSLLLVFVHTNIYTLILFSICFGLTSGGVWVVMPGAVAFYFGKDNFVYYYRVVATFVLLKSVGYAILAFSQHLTHSYDLAYYLFCAVLLACLASTYLLKTTPRA